jgi:hypothetical protein
MYVLLSRRAVKRPPLGARRVRAADDTLSAVEMSGATEARQANLVLIQDIGQPCIMKNVTSLLMA